MVSRRDDDTIDHTRFRNIGEYLDAGVVLVLNTSGTLNAALRGRRSNGESVHVHLSTELPGELWVVELRRSTPEGTKPLIDAADGESIGFDGGADARLLAPYRADQRGRRAQGVRLWVASLHVPMALPAYLQAHGFPIRYGYVREPWPLSYYQTAYATEPGSAEMPSAGRAFTPELLAGLEAKGVRLAPVVLHTGVASLEDHEPPYAEAYRVPAATAQVVNQAREAGRRVIAVGTTAVRALETVAEADGRVHAGSGWTELIIRPERPLRVVDGLLTGLHEPRATHLAMLLALAGPDHVCATYAEALERGYLWHEFGDLHLIL
jgi:S-adenosylmethionine:tRNA ribosyltransferase-isomerase